MDVGAFTPVTMDGNIVVDGVLASCYAFADHDVAHIGMLPLRWFPGPIDWIFGIDNGAPAYVNVIADYGKYGLPY